MIRPLREEDYSAAVAIVNDGWRTVYGEYVNPALLSDAGCRERAAEARLGGGGGGAGAPFRRGYRRPGPARGL